MSLNNRPTILFLYSELAEYFLACVRKLLELYNVEVHIIRWEINKEAPFNLNVPPEAKLYSKDEFTADRLHKLVQNIDPDLVFCSGWMDKDYLQVCKKLSGNIPVIVGFDTQWEGSVKQYFASFLRRFTLRDLFTHAWVAGKPQKEYALRLGFKESQIFEGVYSADVDKFHEPYHLNLSAKRKNYPKRFLYVGRYIKHKGIVDLWTAYKKLKKKGAVEWELWCCGTGPLEREAPQEEGIRHLGFVQPNELTKIAGKTGAFILPSYFEPWGVAVHEFAAAGFPLLCSDKVGAASKFLKDGENGYTFKNGDISDLMQKMKLITNIPQHKLLAMGELSYKLSKEITPSSWSDTLISILDTKEH